MCGICGKLNFDRDEVVSPSLLKAMADSIVHRGPDDDGYYTSGQIGLSRLSAMMVSPPSLCVPRPKLRLHRRSPSNHSIGPAFVRLAGGHEHHVSSSQAM